MTSYRPFILLAALLLLLIGCSNDVDYQPPAGNSETAINHYSFGRMDIDGQSHRDDLAILSDGKIQSWLFDTDSHNIFPTNLKHLISDGIKMLIIGTGYNGLGTLTEETQRYIKQLKSRGIKVQVMDTGKAVQLYNASPKEGLLACFHLNC
jgi:hypothetical protein